VLSGLFENGYSQAQQLVVEVVNPSVYGRADFRKEVLVETQASFLEAYIALVTDDKVVEYLDVEQLARFHDLLRYLDILGTGGWVS